VSEKVYFDGQEYEMKMSTKNDVHLRYARANEIYKYLLLLISKCYGFEKFNAWC